ncbi:mevalonate kinase [Streptomyces sp. NPDC048484]|uniref:mevalonate kinase n=1 Tax=Streptomyces sp. NPDC048484 TaxID=3155146 RepID=UPI0034400AAA
MTFAQAAQVGNGCLADIRSRVEMTREIFRVVLPHGPADDCDSHPCDSTRGTDTTARHRDRVPSRDRPGMTREFHGAASEAATTSSEPAAGRVPDTGMGLTGEGRACGKVILAGEHAVVYGAPALALPVPALTCRARITCQDRDGDGPTGVRCTAVPLASPTDAPQVQDARQAQDAPQAQGRARATGNTPPDGMRILVEALLRRGGPRRWSAVDILLESGIPSARGLGSSAACARAVVHALDDALGLGLSAEAAFQYVQMSEEAAHGKASGIDALATGSSGLVLLENGRVTSPPVGRSCWIVVTDSGRGAGTKEAVAMLRDGFAGRPGRREHFLDRSTVLTHAALSDLRGGRLEALGRRLTDCHVLLASHGLTVDRTDALVNSAVRAGALGAKMSGGGLGGCVIALTATARTADELADRLRRDHHAGSWIVPIEARDGHARV